VAHRLPLCLTISASIAVRAHGRTRNQPSLSVHPTHHRDIKFLQHINLAVAQLTSYTEIGLLIEGDYNNFITKLKLNN